MQGPTLQPHLPATACAGAGKPPHAHACPLTLLAPATAPCAPVSSRAALANGAHRCAAAGACPAGRGRQPLSLLDVDAAVSLALADALALRLAVGLGRAAAPRVRGMSARHVRDCTSGRVPAYKPLLLAARVACMLRTTIHPQALSSNLCS